MFVPGIIVGVVVALGSFFIDMCMINSFAMYLQIF